MHLSLVSPCIPSAYQQLIQQDICQLMLLRPPHVCPMLFSQRLCTIICLQNMTSMKGKDERAVFPYYVMSSLCSQCDFACFNRNSLHENKKRRRSNSFEGHTEQCAEPVWGKPSLCEYSVMCIIFQFYLRWQWSILWFVNVDLWLYIYCQCNMFKNKGVKLHITEGLFGNMFALKGQVMNVTS